MPITFPPEKLRGVLLSAMCVPDLRGTQGMFSHYTTRTRHEGEKIGGEVHHVTAQGNVIQADLIGPENPLLSDRQVLRLPFTVTVKGKDRATLQHRRRRARAARRTSTPTGSRFSSGSRPA